MLLYVLKVFVFGCNDYGQLGLGTKKHVSRPQRVEALLGKCVHHVSCGYYHTVALCSTNWDGEHEVYAWGCNDYGQLGLGHTQHQLLPMQVHRLAHSSRSFASLCTPCYSRKDGGEAGKLGQRGYSIKGFIPLSLWASFGVKPRSGCR